MLELFSKLKLLVKVFICNAMTSKVPKYFLELLYTSKTTVIFLPGVSRATQNLTAVLKDVLVTVGVLHTVLSRPRTFDLCSRNEGLKTSKRKPAQCQNCCHILIQPPTFNWIFTLMFYVLKRPCK